MPPKTLKDLPKEAKMKIASYLPGSLYTVEKVLQAKADIRMNEEDIAALEQVRVHLNPEMFVVAHYEQDRRQRLESKKGRREQYNQQLAIANKKYKRAHGEYYQWLWDDNAEMRRDLITSHPLQSRAEHVENLRDAHAEMG